MVQLPEDEDIMILEDMGADGDDVRMDQCDVVMDHDDVVMVHDDVVMEDDDVEVNGREDNAMDIEVDV